MSGCLKFIFYLFLFFIFVIFGIKEVFVDNLLKSKSGKTQKKYDLYQKIPIPIKDIDENKGISIGKEGVNFFSCWKIKITSDVPFEIKYSGNDWEEHTSLIWEIPDNFKDYHIIVRVSSLYKNCSKHLTVEYYKRL